MSKIDVEQGRIDQICSEFFSKAAQIILQSRIPACDVPPPSSKGVKSNRWFNVDIKDTEFVRDEIEPWRRSPWTPCVIDILLQPEASHAVAVGSSHPGVGFSARPSTADNTHPPPLLRHPSAELSQRRWSWDDRGMERGLDGGAILGAYGDAGGSSGSSGCGGGVRAPGGLAGGRPACTDAHDHSAHGPGPGAEGGSNRRVLLCAACEEGAGSDDSSHGGGSARARLTLLERWVVHYQPKAGTIVPRGGPGSASAPIGAPGYRQPSPHSTSPRGMGPPPSHAHPFGSSTSSARMDESLGTCAGGGGGGPSPPSDHAVEVPVIYKRAVILLRSLVSLSRMLPAYDLYRAVGRSARPPGYSLVHRVHASPDARPGFCSCPPGAAGGGGRTRGGAGDLGSFTFAPVHTSQGRLEVTVAYVHTVGLPAAEELPPPSPLPHIITEYIGSPGINVDPSRFVGQDAKPGLPLGPSGASPSSASTRGFSTVGGGGGSMPPRQNSAGQLAGRGEAGIAQTLAQFGFVTGGGAVGGGAGTPPSHPQGGMGVTRVASWSSTTPLSAVTAAAGRALPPQGGISAAGGAMGGWATTHAGGGATSGDAIPSAAAGGAVISKSHSLGRDTKSRPPPSPSPSSSYGHLGGMAVYGSSPPTMMLPPPPQGARQISPTLSGTSPNTGGVAGAPARFGATPIDASADVGTRQGAGAVLAAGDGKRPSSAPVRIPLSNNGGGGSNGGPSAGALLAARGAGAGLASTHHTGGAAQHRPYTSNDGGGGAAASNPMPVLFKQASAPVGSLYMQQGSSGGGGYSFGSSLGHGSPSQDGSVGSNGGDASTSGAVLMMHQAGTGAAPMLATSPHRALHRGPGSLGGDAAGVVAGAAGIHHGGGMGVGAHTMGVHLLKRAYSSGSAPTLLSASSASGSEGSSCAPSVLSQSPQLPFAVASGLSASQSLVSDTGSSAPLGGLLPPSGAGLGISATSPPMSGRHHLLMGGLRSPSVSPGRPRPDMPPQPPSHAPQAVQHVHSIGNHAVVPFSSSNSSPNGYTFMGQCAPRFHLSDAAGGGGGLSLGAGPHRKLSGLPPGMLPQQGVHLPSSSLMFCSGQPGAPCAGLCGPTACGGKPAHLLPHQLAPSPMRVEWGCWLPGGAGTPADCNLIMALVETSSEGGTDTTTDDLDSFPFAVDMDCDPWGTGETPGSAITPAAAAGTHAHSPRRPHGTRGGDPLGLGVLDATASCADFMFERDRGQYSDMLGKPRVDGGVGGGGGRVRGAVPAEGHASADSVVGSLIQALKAAAPLTGAAGRAAAAAAAARIQGGRGDTFDPAAPSGYGGGDAQQQAWGGMGMADGSGSGEQQIQLGAVLQTLAELRPFRDSLVAATATQASPPMGTCAGVDT